MNGEDVKDRKNMNKYYIRQWMPSGKYQFTWVYAETKEEAVKLATPVKIEIAHVITQA